MRARHENYDTNHPWVIYIYGRTHDTFWPPWSSTRVLGRMAIDLECMVCGDRTRQWLRIPRFGIVNPSGGHHPGRVKYLAEHAHRDRGAPMSWARPLRNIAAHEGGLNLDGLAMRLEADRNEDPDE
jgi:hypothetical protein